MLIFLHENVTNEHHNLPTATDFRINFTDIILYNFFFLFAPKMLNFLYFSMDSLRSPTSKNVSQNTVAHELSLLHITVEILGKKNEKPSGKLTCKL